MWREFPGSAVQVECAAWLRDHAWHFPFAPRALDRGQAALLVSYVRLLGNEFNENSQAGRVTGDHLYFAAAIEEFTQRAITITGSAEVGGMVREDLEELIDCSRLPPCPNKSMESTLPSTC